MRAALLLACACLACETAPTPTETIVVVNAESSIQALATKLHARVQSESDGIVRFDHEFKPHWPVWLAVVPRGGDATREFELTLAVQRADGSTPIVARVHTGFVKDAKRYHRVLLSEDCLGLPCGQGTTCRKGSCVSSHVPTRTLVANCSDASCRKSSGAEDAGQRDADADGGPGDGEATASCDDMQLACKGGCVARDSVDHCGACDRDCTQLPNVDGPTRCDTDHCAFESSACSPGHDDCNGDPDDGCETELNEPQNCGTCGATCDEPQLCAATASGHACVSQCPGEGQVACDGSCVELASDPQHCGECSAACEPGARCEAGRCGEACIDGTACMVSECRGGELRCEASGEVCEAAEPVPVREGMTCGAAGSCTEGHCTCGVSDGRGGPFGDCRSEADCQRGTVCSDWNGSGQFLCRPLCATDAECADYPFEGLRCAAALCSNDGRDPGIRVCVEQDGKLAPAYDDSRCCGGPGSEGVSADGCSDGTREAFTDLATFPSIAGCEAKWPLKSMRDPATGVACGNTLGVECMVPADACATGWHVCGTPNYGPLDISNKLTAEECSVQPGRFAMALADTDCEPCTGGAGKGAACCGMDCVKGYKSCVFPNQTSWFGWDGTTTNLCGEARSTVANQGVMCCRGY